MGRGRSTKSINLVAAAAEILEQICGIGSWGFLGRSASECGRYVAVTGTRAAQPARKPPGGSFMLPSLLGKVERRENTGTSRECIGAR